MDPSQLQPGYRLDRYELLCPLAYGGMASVWLARFGGRLGFERLVVVKMILPQYSQDARFQEMFLDEARIASKIEHPNVARILDVGEVEGNYFIVMEWVDGDSLSKISRAAEQRKEKIPMGVALRICGDAAAGLHAAHELKDRDGKLLGVVHRDVSPQNILVGNNGSTMIIDFGVAKARDRVSQETSAGQLKGKIRYMAPEQALGKVIDHRADVWAIGAMLYETFTGDPPYEGTNEVATLHRLTSGQPPPPLPDTFPPPICALVNKALAYEATDRFASAIEMTQAIEKAMVDIGEPTTTATVAHYTGQLLQDRKGARRRAVDFALEQAKKRDGGGGVTPASNPSLAVGRESQGTLPLAAPPVSQSVVAQSTPNVPPVGPPLSVPEVSSTPSASGQNPVHTPSTLPRLDYAQHGLGESPSAASNATLGSANIEYPPPDVTAQARRRRYIGAAVIGVFGAAGLVGAVLIVSATMMRHAETTAHANDPLAATSSLPAPVMTTAATATTTATTTPSDTTAPATPPSDTTTAAPEPTDTTASTKEPAKETATAATTTTARPPGTIPSHRPWTPGTAVKPGNKHPDRGF